MLGRTVHRPHHRAGANEERKDARRPDTRKGHDRNSAPTVGHVSLLTNSIQTYGR